MNNLKRITEIQYHEKPYKIIPYNQDALVKANNYQITDSFSFVDPIINIHTANDKSNIQITATSNNALQNINLAGTVNTYSDGLAIKWKPSYFLLNQKRWDINNGGEISLRKNNFRSTNT